MKGGWAVLLLVFSGALGVAAFAWLRGGESPGDPAAAPTSERGARRGEEVRIAPLAAVTATSRAREVEGSEPPSERRAAAQLRSGSRLSGWVLWPDRTPAVAAEVLVRSKSYSVGRATGSTQRWKRDERVVRSDRSGAFAVDGLGPGPFALRARLERDGERWCQVVYEVAAGSDGVRLVLRAPVSLSGVAIDDAGRPVVPAEVTLEPVDGPHAWTHFRRRATRVSESAVGAFAFRDLLAGPYVLRAEAEGHGRSLALEVDGRESRSDLVLELQRASVLAGTVLDPHGAPVPGALIACVFGSTASADSWDLGEVQLDCGEDGSFRLVDLPPGPLTLRAYHADWAASLDLHLELQPGQHRPGVNLALRRGGRLTGVVYGDDGRPALGARVAAENSDAESSRETLADGSGEFVFERLAPDDYQVVARWDGAGEALEALRLAAATVLEGATTHVVLGGTGGRAVRVTGRVTAAGRPVPDARVIALGEGADTLSSTRMGVCDASGAYELVLPGPGAVTFAVWRAEGAGSAAEFHEHLPDARAARLDFALPAGGLVVTATAPDGAPAAHVPVAVAREDSPLSATNLFFAPDQRTDGSGRRAFPMLAPGRYTVRVGGEDEQGAVHFGRALRSGIEVRGATVQVALSLPRPAEVAGVVVDGSGLPYPGALVYVRDAKGRTLDPFPSCYTDAAGRFRYRGVPPGGVSVFARTAERAAAESVQVTLAAGSSVELRLQLSRATRLLVTALDADGEALVARLSVRDASNRELAGLLSTNDVEQVLQRGISTTEHVVGPLPPGRYRVALECADGRRAAREVELDGRERERRLALEVR